jgi:hypothetical protein
VSAALPGLAAILSARTEMKKGLTFDDGIDTFDLSRISAEIEVAAIVGHRDEIVCWLAAVHCAAELDSSAVHKCRGEIGH